MFFKSLKVAFEFISYRCKPDRSNRQNRGFKLTSVRVRTQDQLLESLRPGIDGLILREGDHRATFLPQVWEQLPDRLTFLQHLRHKAGLPPDQWSAHIRFWTYQTQSFERFLSP